MSINLEVGKYYRTRDGRKVGPMRKWDFEPGLFDCADMDGEYWSENGFNADGPDGGIIGERELDLIAEWFDEPAAEPAPEPATPNRYARTINGATVDVYDILAAFNVTCPATHHAIKKLLMPGQRGGKSVTQDLREALASVHRAIDMAGE